MPFEKVRSSVATIARRLSHGQHPDRDVVQKPPTTGFHANRSSEWARQGPDQTQAPSTQLVHFHRASLTMRPQNLDRDMGIALSWLGSEAGATPQGTELGRKP